MNITEKKWMSKTTSNYHVISMAATGAVFEVESVKNWILDTKYHIWDSETFENQGQWL